jgi:hypothetical protein
MENKQTAVEWLWEQIDNTIPFQNIQTSQIFNGLLEQAKEMEKQQIINTYRDGRSDQQSEKPSRFYNRWAELYYNETYGK